MYFINQDTANRENFNNAIKYNKNDFDAVCILTPHNTHYHLAMKSFEVNKHVLLEKPMALDLKYAKKILTKSKKRKAKFLWLEKMQLIGPK